MGAVRKRSGDASLPRETSVDFEAVICALARPFRAASRDKGDACELLRKSLARG
jgi:hypothetical protein